MKRISCFLLFFSFLNLGTLSSSESRISNPIRFEISFLPGTTLPDKQGNSMLKIIVRNKIDYSWYSKDVGVSIISYQSGKQAREYKTIGFERFLFIVNDISTELSRNKMAIPQFFFREFRDDSASESFKNSVEVNYTNEFALTEFPNPIQISFSANSNRLPCMVKSKLKEMGKRILKADKYEEKPVIRICSSNKLSSAMRYSRFKAISNYLINKIHVDGNQIEMTWNAERGNQLDSNLLEVYIK
jgi:hypothetical protein